MKSCPELLGYQLERQGHSPRERDFQGSVNDPTPCPIGSKDTQPETSSRVSFMESAVILYYFNLFVVLIDSMDIMVDGVINDKVGVFILRIMIVVRFLYLMSICVHQLTANYLS